MKLELEGSDDAVRAREGNRAPNVVDASRLNDQHRSLVDHRIQDPALRGTPGSSPGGGALQALSEVFDGAGPEGDLAAVASDGIEIPAGLGQDPVRLRVE